MSTFTDSFSDFNQLKLGLCGPPKPLHEYTCALSLKHPQFCCAKRHCFRKDPQCSTYLLQEMMNPSFSQSLVWLYLLTLYLPRGKLSLRVTELFSHSCFFFFFYYSNVVTRKILITYMVVIICLLDSTALYVLVVFIFQSLSCVSLQPREL